MSDSAHLACTDDGCEVVPVTDGDSAETMLQNAVACGSSTEVIELMAKLYREEREDARRGLFDAAMVAAQSEMVTIATDCENKQTRSRYASFAALNRALRPIYTRHGFALTFDTSESPREGHVRILCRVSHTGRYGRDYHIDMPADGKGAKGGDVMTTTHALGSAVSYGCRYLLRMIFNVSVGESDDDGNAAGQGPTVNTGELTTIAGLCAEDDRQTGSASGTCAGRLCASLRPKVPNLDSVPRAAVEGILKTFAKKAEKYK